MKDLVDLILLIDTGSLDKARIQAALEATFKRRATHPLSMEFPNAPAGWEKPSQGFADEVGLALDVTSGVKRVHAFLLEVANG